MAADGAKRHDRTNFFKYVTLDGLGHITSHLSRQWSSPITFNDPFDSQFDCGFSFSFEAFSEAFLNAIEEMVFGEKEPKGVAQHPLFHQIMIARGNRTKRTRNAFCECFQPVISGTIPNLKRSQAIASQVWATYLNNLRILCLTEDPANLLMWSHYANQHTGAMIRLRCIRDRDSVLLAALPVHYTDCAPYIGTQDEWICHLTGQKEIDYDSHFRKLITSKSTRWAYEKEWRVINFKRPGDNGLLMHDTFWPEEIEAIYFGCRANDSKVSDILKAMHPELKHVELFRAKKRQWEFEIDYEKMG